MPRYSRILLALAALIFFSAPVQAANAPGAELQYVWRGVKVSEARYAELRMFEMNPPGRGDAVLLGGNTFYSLQWAEVFPKAPVRNFADRSSSVSPQLLRARVIADAAPERIFVLSGENGMMHAEYAMRDLNLIKDLLTEIRMRSPRSKLYVLTFHALPENQGGLAARMFNKRLRALVNVLGLELLDFEKAIDQARTEDRGLLVLQNGMLGPEGYVTLAELLAPYIGVCRICR